MQPPHQNSSRNTKLDLLVRQCEGQYYPMPPLEQQSYPTTTMESLNTILDQIFQNTNNNIRAPSSFIKGVGQTAILEETIVVKLNDDVESIEPVVPAY